MALTMFDRARWTNKGREAEIFQSWLTSRLSEAVVTMTVDGSRVFMEFRVHLTMKSGKEYRNRYVMRVDLVDGKVSRCKEYYNPIQSAYAFGRLVAGKHMLESL